jgi:hypothetical protein
MYMSTDITSSPELHVLGFGILLALSSDPLGGHEMECIREAVVDILRKI